MIAKDIMTKEVVFMKPATTIAEAVSILVDNRISAAPVIDDSGSLAGIVSEKDLLVCLDFLGWEKGKTTVISNFMSKGVISFSEESPVKEIMQELVRRNIKRVPIVKEGRIVGIVSRRDILKAMQNRQGASS